MECSTITNRSPSTAHDRLRPPSRLPVRLERTAAKTPFQTSQTRRYAVRFTLNCFSLNQLGSSIMNAISIFSAFVFLFPFSALAETPPSAEPREATAVLQPPASLPAGRGNSFNPEIGINGLILYANGSEGALADSTEPNGLHLQELELQFSADVDPYSRFVALLSLHSETEVDATTLERSTEYLFEPEEVYAESLSIPSIALKAGKFKGAFGKHNTLHTHAFPFIDAPLYQTHLLGEEGLNDIGLSAAALMPTPWYFELTAQALKGEAEGLEYFNSRSSSDLVAVVKAKNLWETSETSTIELGLSGAAGDNRLEGRTELLGADLTFKWRPLDGGRDTSIAFVTEYIGRSWEERGGAKNESHGLASWIQYQFARSWWAQGRAEWLGSKDIGAVTNPGTLPERMNKWSALVAFAPSEFSAFRVQYDNLDTAGTGKAEHRVLAQMNFSIGAHPAHQY